MRYIQGLAVPTGTAEGTLDFSFPRNVYIQSVMIQDQHSYPMYVRILWYHDDSDEYPEVLFADWVRATCEHYDIPSITLNKFVDYEKGLLRICFLNQTAIDITPIVIVHYAETKTSQTNYYCREKHFGVWAYDDLIERHTDAGVLSFTITPHPGTWFDLDMMRLTGGFSGAETITVTHEDVALATLKLIGEVSTTTGTIELPILATSEEDNTASTAESIGKLRDRYRIHYPDHLLISVSSVPATDDIAVQIRARLKSRIPTIAYIGNTQAQAAYVNDYSRVI